MKEKNRRKPNRLLVIVLVALGLAGTALVTSMLVLQNPYTQAGYPGWQEVSIGGMEPFLIPGEWRLSVGESDAAAPERLPVTVTDEAGGEIAQGYVFPEGVTQQTFTPAVELLAGATLSEYRVAGGFTMELLGSVSNFRRCIFFSNDAKILDTWCLELSDGGADLFLWFPYCEGQAFQSLSDQVKGVVSSFRD